MHMEGILLAAYVGCQSCFNRSDRCIYWPEQGNWLLSPELFPFFCMYIVPPFSPFLLYTSFFHAYCYLPSFCLSRASPGLHFFPSLLFSGSFVQCAQLFLKFLAFPIPGRSIIIALNVDVQPRIKAPFPFQNILFRPWLSRLAWPTEHPVGYTWLNHGFVDWVLFCIVGKMGRRSNGLSE